MLKAALIGVSGGRAHGHAAAYQHIKRARLAAVSARQPAALKAFADQYDVPARYTDYREMLAREKPDLVQVSTPPDARIEIFQAALEAGVPALLVEKPLAIQAEDFLAIKGLRRGQTRHQNRHQSSAAFPPAAPAAAATGR